jgi:hypothetical protein
VPQNYSSGIVDKTKRLFSAEIFKDEMKVEVKAELMGQK